MYVRHYTGITVKMQGESKAMSVFFQYNILVKAAELGSLTLAAEALGCTQSNVSHAIGTLEKEFGFPLKSPPPVRRMHPGPRI